MYSSFSNSSSSMEHGRKRHVRLSRAQSYVILCTLALIAIFGDVDVLTMSTRRLEEDELYSDDETTTAPPASGSPPPIIYTFFSELGAQPMAGGMAEEDHKRLLNHWKREWREAGWDPIVLSMKDARKHPDFMKLKPLLKETGAGPYNILCFVRWLAVAFAGGGWMADYDVFPLHDFRDEGRVLPNDGTLTIHNRLCPSLVSGSAQEWTRVANEMIHYAATNHINSDQNALAAIFRERQDHAAFEQDWSVTQTVFNATGWTADTCREHTPSSMRAVHFAHTPMKRALKEGRLPAGWSMRQRPEVASQFISQWLAQCGDRKPFQRDSRLLLQSRSTEYKQQTIISTDTVVTVDSVAPKVAVPKSTLNSNTNTDGSPPNTRQATVQRTTPVEKGYKKEITPLPPQEPVKRRNDGTVVRGSKKISKVAAATPKDSMAQIKLQEISTFKNNAKNAPKSDDAKSMVKTNAKNTAKTAKNPAVKTAEATMGKISRARYMQALGGTESVSTVGQTTPETKAVVKPLILQSASNSISPQDFNAKSRVPKGSRKTPPVTQKKKAKYNPARGLLG